MVANRFQSQLVLSHSNPSSYLSNGNESGIILKVASVEDGKAEHERATWGNPVEFLMSCISMSVGLGNIWRFPYTAYSNGGGAFLIPYLIVLAFIGKPLYFMEMAMGQFCSFGSVKVWKMAPILKGQ